MGSMWKLQLLLSLFICFVFIHIGDAFCPCSTNVNSWSLTNEMKLIISISRVNGFFFICTGHKSTYPGRTGADCSSPWNMWPQPLVAPPMKHASTKVTAIPGWSPPDDLSMRVTQHEQILNVPDHQGHVNQNYNDLSSHLSEWLK